MIIPFLCNVFLKFYERPVNVNMCNLCNANIVSHFLVITVMEAVTQSVSISNYVSEHLEKTHHNCL